MPVVSKEDSRIEDEKIVISGMSGLFPECRNVKELSDVLYNKKNPITTENCRWKYKHPEILDHVGKIPELNLFDAQFFMVHYRLGNNMDCICRKVLEQAYQAIYDAGIGPEELNGKKIGVYVGCGFSDSEKACFFNSFIKSGLTLTGGNRSMFANRISYWLNAKGPSMCLDQACCSSMTALESGCDAIQHGECEAAIVAGCSVCLHPHNIVHYQRLMTMSADGKTRSFDKNANGFVRSEAINVLFLQKAKNALRAYAEVVHVKSRFTELINGETGPQYGFKRNVSTITDYLNEFYKEADVSPTAVEYVEAFGIGIPDVDKSELEAISEVFCKERKEPLLVGSVMSNIGYSDGATGLSAITKVLLGYNTGKLAANLHSDNPRDDIDAIKKGNLLIVNEHKDLTPSYTAINNMSFNGVNAHVLLKGFNKPKDLCRYKSSIPHLVVISGRQETSVTKILDDLKSRPIDPEELGLLHNIHVTKISGHLGRGFTILDTNEKKETISLSEKVEYFDSSRRPLWFVYSGMGSQWLGMGTQLMRMPIFAKAIERCRVVLEPKGVDIIRIISENDPKIFDNILNSFVGIAAIQIGLTDILRELGIVPDIIIGHSVGELGCAYADGCLSTDEMILSSYSRGLVSAETPFIFGSMAAVGMGYQEILKILPPEIEVACHNSPTSCTISGPAQIMSEFVFQLTKKGVFAKEVPCSNIAYHSKYIAEAGPGLLKYLRQVIKTPKLRSGRWLSTSVPVEKWNEPEAMYSSAEYHTNNLLNPVLFEEISKLIPSNAVVVEIAPHGLLQAILKRSLPTSCTNVSLTQRDNPDSVRHLLEAVGQLFMVGYNPTVKALYPKIEFPVSNGTPMLTHLVDWAHNEKWNIPLYVPIDERRAAASNFIISTHDDEYNYLKGHVIRETNVYPFAASLVAIWDCLCMSLGKSRKEVSVQMNQIHFHAQPMLGEKVKVHLGLHIHRGSGRFEVMDGTLMVITGFITVLEKKEENNNKIKDNNDITLNSEDIYKLFYIRDYHYSGYFQSLHSANASLNYAKVLWNDNWVTFLDGILQLNFMRSNHDTVSQLKYIKNINIDVEEHNNYINSLDGGSKLIIAHVDELEDSTSCGGIFMQNIRLNNLPSTNKTSPIMNPLKFVPHFSTTIIDEASIMLVYLQAVAENLNKDVIDVIKITDKNKEDDTSTTLKNIMRNFTNKTFKFTVINKHEIIVNTFENIDLLIIENLSTDEYMCRIFYKILDKNTFIINKEVCDKNSMRSPLLYRVINAHNSGTSQIELIRWRPTSFEGSSAMSIYSPSDLKIFLSTVKSLPSKHHLIIFSSYPPLPNLKDIIMEHRKKHDISLLMIKSGNKFEENNMFNTGLAFNVIIDDMIGGEYNLPIQETMTVKGGMMLETTCYGDLNSLRWVEVAESSEVGIPVTVHYAGVSIVDAKKMCGVVATTNKKQNLCGMEFSGIVDGTGTRIMGLVEGGAVNTRIKANLNMIWPVPDYWSLEDAATVPLAYCLAFYCFAIKSHLYSGMRIFIHGGAGALGQALISVALAHNCEVFVTVSSLSKKHFLRRLYPQLRDDHIGNSRDDSFCDMVLTLTKGKGCDIVICTVKRELRSVTLKCCAPSGVTIDTGLLQDKEDYNLCMDFMWNSRSYTTVDITSLFAPENIDTLKHLQLLLSEGIAKGIVRPLTRVMYAASDVNHAFNLLTNSLHRGRVLLDLKEIGPIMQTRIKCSSELNHFVVSDDDILGIQLAERLISRGVKKLYLQWRYSSKILEFRARLWEKQGINVKISYDNIIDANTAQVLLDKITNSVSIEGIYLLAREEDYANKVENILKQLTLMIQEFNPFLKYSAIVKVDKNVEEKRCNLVPHDQMPLMVKLPNLKQFNDSQQSKNLITAREAVDAVEFALTSQQPVMALTWTTPKPNILDYILDISGVSTHNITRKTQTLRDLGVNASMSEIIQSFLRDNYNMSMSQDDILFLTIEDINNLEKKISSHNEIDIEGLHTFFSYLDQDELQATTKIVLMPTLIKNVDLFSDEFDISQKYLCIIPGIEGHHGRFSTLCERLKLRALVLQPGYERCDESWRELAERLVQVMLKKSNDSKRFYILGYESGVLVALEMAAILEDNGWTGTVYCLGGSPDDISNIFNDELKMCKTDEDLQIAVVKHLFKIMTEDNTNELDDMLKRAKTWKERVDTTVMTLRGRIGYSIQFTKELIEATYSRIKQMCNFKPKPLILKSLLVSISHQVNTKSLKQYSEQPVIEYNLKTRFSSLTQDLQCAAIINRHLESDILQEFDNSDLCDIYLLNSKLFMNPQQ